MADIKENLTGKVVCYGRVSTRLIEQESSLEAQEEMFKDFLDRNDGLECVGIYLDQESGKTSERKNFLAMLARVSQGDISYIVAKDSSRLSRSSEVSGALNRLCEAHGCNILYISKNEMYNPTDRSDRLVNSIFTAVNEDYVYRQSELGKISHMLKVQQKRLSRQNEVYGYRWNDETHNMEIHEGEAAVVKLIYELYVFRNKGVQEISRDLESLGIVGTKSGKRITPRTITQRLTCTAYKGQMAFNKSSSILVTGVGAKNKRKFLPEDEYVYVEVPAIVSEELWDLAQMIRKERAHIFSVKGETNVKEVSRAKFSGMHLFAGKIFCGVCGHSYHHGYYDRDKTIGYYKDSFAKTNTVAGKVCENKAYNKIFEEQLKDIVTEAINTFIKEHDEIFNNTLNLLKRVLENGDCDKSSKELQQRLTDALKEKNSWLSAYRDAVSIKDKLLKEECLKSFREASEKVSALEKLINGGKERSETVRDIEDRLKCIKERIEELKVITELTREDVKNFINRIEVMPNGTINIILTASAVYTANIQTYTEFKETLKARESLFFYVTICPNIEDFLKDDVKIYLPLEKEPFVGKEGSIIEYMIGRFEIPLFRYECKYINNVISPKSSSIYVCEKITLFNGWVFLRL